MAQSASLAEAKAIQARQNLENYVFGTSVSTVPPVIPPMLPRGVAPFPAYPYASSPTQWPVGTVPLAKQALPPEALLSFCLSDKCNSHINKLSDFL